MKPEFILTANDGSSGFSYTTELLPSRRAPGMVLLLRVRFCGQQTSSSLGDKCVCTEERGGAYRDQSGCHTVQPPPRPMLPKRVSYYFV